VKLGNALSLEIPGGSGKLVVRVTHADGVSTSASTSPKVCTSERSRGFLDADPEAPRLAGAKSFMVSFSPKNSCAEAARRFGRIAEKVWEESNVIGVMAYAVTDDPKRWTAELSIDLKRFSPTASTKARGSRSESAGRKRAIGVGGPPPPPCRTSRNVGAFLVK
jgi:hypothetical protein